MITPLMVSVLATYGSCYPVRLPTARYDYAPTHYVRYVYVDYWDVQAECRALGVHTDRYGRIMDCGKRNLVILPRVDGVNIDARMQRCLRRHEEGHANGWGPFHED